MGIYKAIGFNSEKLRLQSAFRFLIASVPGFVLGVVLGVLFSGKAKELK